MRLLDWPGNSRSQTAPDTTGRIAMNEKIETLATSLFIGIVGTGYSDSVIRSDLNRPKGPGLYATLAIDLATTFCAAIEQRRLEEGAKAAA